MGRMPKFIGHLQNVTVSLGREATFTCTVTHLGGHRVSHNILINFLKFALDLPYLYTFAFLVVVLQYNIFLKNRLRG